MHIQRHTVLRFENTSVIGAYNYPPDCPLQGRIQKYGLGGREGDMGSRLLP